MSSSVSNVRKKTGRPPVNAVPLSVRVPPDLLTAIDTFISERADYGESLSRPEAVRRLTAEALQKMGLMKAG